MTQVAQDVGPWSKAHYYACIAHNFQLNKHPFGVRSWHTLMVDQQSHT